MKKYLFVFSIFILLFTSCKDETVTPEDPVLTKANIEGQVSLFEENGESMQNYRMIVSLEGGVGNYMGETEKDGNFLIQNAPYHNNYTIVYEKQGFGTYKKFGFNHEYTGFAGTIPGISSLGEISTTNVTQLGVEVVGEEVELEVKISTVKEKGEKYIRFLFHTIQAIGPEVFSHHTGRFTLNTSEHTLVFTKEYLQGIGLESGVKYFVQGYGASYYSNGYFDEDLQKMVLPNLGYKDAELVPTDDFVMP